MHRIQIITIALLFAFTGAFAQTPKQLPEDRTAFMTALEEMMNAAKRDDNKETFETFSEHVTTGKYSETQFADIQKIANRMLAAKMSVNPYFESYLTSLNMMTVHEQNSKFVSYFNALNSVIDAVKSSNKSTYKNFTIFATNLFQYNALRYSKGSSMWVSSNDSYTIEYKDGKPLVRFTDLDLLGIRKSDTIEIKGTSGVYFPSDNVWRGTKGEVTWARTKFGEDVRCTFGRYKIETKKSGYEVDTATLYYSDYFSKPIDGSFEDRIITGASKKDHSYPRFSSFTKVMEINNIGEGIKYRGGFRLSGDDINGYGDSENKAIMQFTTKSGKLAINARAESFLIRKGERIVSDGAAVSIYHGQDSIFHPRIGFKFDVNTRELTLTRGETGIEKAPFYNSYHKFEIDAAKIDWQIDSDSIEIGKEQKVGAKRNVVLESVAYYNADRYRRFQNIASFHPLTKIASYAASYDSPYIEAEDLAAYISPNYELKTILGLLTDLMEQGFIVYYPETQMVEVKEKVFHWVDAHAKKTDYDNIRILSNNERATNGQLNIEDNSLTLHGVKNVILSDSQLVVIKPANAELTVERDRNMRFNGQVFAGYGVFKGRNFQFDYDNYDIEMDTINSFSIRYEVDKDVDGVPLLNEVKTRVEDMTGHLQIDAPDNKSGREDDPAYASFVSRSKARAYYDNRRIQDGAYKRDSFYFELEPFTFDSLNSFDPSGIVFPGEMHTTGIFPTFKEKLRIQTEDNSLGFTHKTPPGGLPTYTKDGKNRGNYANDITLNGSGLWGSGEITFLNSKFESDEINFLPEAMQAQANTFNIEERRTGTEYPKVDATDVFVKWAPYRDSMYIKSDDKPFNFFNNEKQLEGDLVFTTGGLYGSGRLDWQDATMISKKLLFGFNGVKADTANLTIKALDEGIEQGKLAFNTKNVNADLNFETQRGTFVSNSGDITTEMPYNQYKTSMNRFTWNMRNDQVIFSSKTGKKGEFLSINPAQDSLIFLADSAVYDLQDNMLDIEGVDLINVADAIIYPDDKYVAIRENADMEPLEKSTILANTKNRYHKIQNATIKIKGKNEYQAEGYYTYETGGREQEVLFDDIVVKKKKKKKEYVTVGSGTIDEEDNFLIDDKIKFMGDVKLRADAKNLKFRGFAKIDSDALQRTGWFSVNARVDKENVAIAYKDPVTVDGAKLHVGLMMNVDSAHVYPANMSASKVGRDVQIFDATGVLKHDKKRKQFVFGDSSQVILNGKRGNKLTVNEVSGKVTAEGSFDFDKAYKDNIHIKTAGVAVWEDGIAKFDLIGGLNLPLPARLLEILADDLYGYGDELPDIDVNDKYIDHAIAEFVSDDKKVDRIMADYRSGGYLTLPKEDDYPFFFTKLPLRWNENTYSFTSKFIGISSIGGKPVEKIVKCYFEVKMLNSIPSFTMYIDSPSDDWYYISYKSGRIATLSSNEEYSGAVLDMKKRDRVKAPNGEYLDIVLDKLENVRYFSGKMKNN